MEDPNRTLAAFIGYDAWRGYPDGAWTNNGIHTGISFGTRLGNFSEVTGVGFQIGGSIGVYDWSGTDYRVANRNQPTTQGFVTYGLFRKADSQSRWSASIVHDWMINNNYSVMAEDSTLGQFRGQFGYVVSDRDEFGVWAAVRARSDTRTVGAFGPVTWRPVNQLNAYWHHKWGDFGPDSWISVGVPERDRLTGGGSLGDYIVGAFAICPMGDRVSLYSMVNYMHPSATPGPAAAKEEAWNFYIGLLVYPRPIARSPTIFGRRWTPQLPVANNGLFLVDASRTY